LHGRATVGPRKKKGGFVVWSGTVTVGVVLLYLLLK